MRKDSDVRSCCFKNMICVSVGLLIIFTTAIFVAKDYFGLKVKTMIEDASLLKDYRFADWGQLPGTLDADHSFVLTVVDHSQEKPAPMPSVDFSRSFAYRNASFGQGNQGFIRYLHNWQLTANKKLPDTPIATLNLAAEKVFGYERLAPVSRRFAVMYNALWESVSGMLIKFYSAQLHQFYFKNQKVVYSAVFAEAGLDQATMDAVYTHPQLGMKSVDTFEKWVRLAHRADFHDMPEYEEIRDGLALDPATLERLVGPHSMLSTLSTALNGTIKLILENPKAMNYKNCDPFCEDEQLIAFQLLTGGLTNSAAFVNVNLQETMRDVNSTLLNDIEFNIFCPECMPDDNYLDFFAQKLLGNFTTMSKVFQNLDNPDIVQSLFDLPEGDYTEHITDYLTYLMDNVFNPAISEEKVDYEAYDFMLNNYLYVNTLINDLKEIIHTEMHARALLTLFKDAKCADFFQGNYKDFVGVCDKKELDPTTDEGVRTYIKAYFFEDRLGFGKQTGMKAEQIAQFLRLDQNSLFASQIKKVRTLLKQTYNCVADYCSAEELLVREWSGENDVLSNLPAELFPTAVQSILEWDSNNRFQGVQPQYHKVMGEKLSTEQGQLLLGSGPQSILVLSNLLVLKTSTDSGDEAAKKTLNYVNKVVIDTYFGGPASKLPLSDFVSGYKSVGIMEKQACNQLLGGAEWIPQQVTMLETKHSSTAFSKVNTGLYERDSLRQVLEYDHYTTLGSQFTVYETEFSSVKEYLPSGRRVFGTDLLGFHSDISVGESLTAFLDFAYQGVVLDPQDASYAYKDVTAIKFSIRGAGQPVDIGKNQQNQRSLTISPQSYFIVDPITGNTLQYLVKYSVSAKPTFLRYYPAASTQEMQLYSAEVSFTRNDVDAIKAINEQKQMMRSVYIATIVLASVSMISVAAFALLYRIRVKKTEAQLQDTLLSSQGGSLVE